MTDGTEAFWCEVCDVMAWAGEHDCQCCERVQECGEGNGHSPECENYDGPPNGDAWSGGFAPNH